MWRSVAAKSRQVARNFGATQNPYKVSTSQTLTLSPSQSRFPIWLFSKPSLSHKNLRFLSQFSPIPSETETDHSSLGSTQNGDDVKADDFAPLNDSLWSFEEDNDTQLEKFSPGEDLHGLSEQFSQPFAENIDTQTDLSAPGGEFHGVSGQFPRPLGENSDTPMGHFGPRDVNVDMPEQFSGDFVEEGDNQVPGEEKEEIKAYEIDMEKLEAVLSLLQSSVDGSLESSLDSMGLDLHDELVLKVLETPLILGENLIRFFKWAMKKPEINVTTCVIDAVVRSICSGLRKKDAYALWDLVREMGEKESVLPSVESLNQLIALFSKLGKGKAALEVFDKFGDFGYVPDSETYYFTIEALCRRSFFELAWSVCEKLLNEGALPDSEKVGKIISWFCKGNKAKDAHAVYIFAKEKSKYPPQSAVNFLIGSLCREDGTVKLALEMLNDFSGEKRKYAIKPFSSVIRGLCRSKDVDGAKQLLSKMIAEGPPPGNAVFNSVINGYSKGGDMEEAMEMMKLMKIRGLKPDVYTYTVIMSGYVSGGQMEEACNILSEAKKKHSKLSPVTYHTLIRGYCKLEQFDKALGLLAEMKEFGVQPNVDEYNKLIQSLCLKALDWGTAEKLLEEMKENGLHLNAITRSLIRAVKELEEEGLDKELSTET